MLNPADAAFEAGLRARLSEAAFRPLEPRYLEEPRGLFQGQGGLLVAPGSVEEVGEVVRACLRERVAVVPYGGGTGLVGGQVAPGAPVILSLERMRAVRAPFADLPDWAVLIELGQGADSDPEGALLALFEAALGDGLASDGVVAASGAQRAALWAMREQIPEANKRIGSISSHDISLPLSAIPAFLQRAGAAIGALGPFRVNAFGHLGDGNLHYNVFPPRGAGRADFAGQKDAIRETVYAMVAEFEGSFSAEHGVGRLKVAELARYGDPARRAAMRAIKTALDPQGIMNPGVLFG